MDLKKALCEEFCAQISIRSVPAGLAVGTEFAGLNGDPIGFYIVGPDAEGKYRIEDNGATLTVLEACGADLDIESRAHSFNELISGYGVSLNEQVGELYTPQLGAAELPKAALRFVAMLLRVQDLLMTTHERVANTFKEEALREIRQSIGLRAEIIEDSPVADSLSEWSADAIIRAPNREPIALFFVLTDTRLYEAIMMQMEAAYRVKFPCTVVALLEKSDSVSPKAASHAQNRVSVRRYRGDEQEAVAAISRQALGTASAFN
jgi:hypothetical protein